MNQRKDALRRQIEDAAGNVHYTYVAHWKIVKTLRRQFKAIKITQIALTSLSTCGFFAAIISGIPSLSWIGGLASALALAFNLYMLNFNIAEESKQHLDAANRLWEIREEYKSLLTDFDSFEIDDIRRRRDDLTQRISSINNNYPGTTEKAFAEAQKDIYKYKFEDGEAAKLLHTSENK